MSFQRLDDDEESSSSSSGGAVGASRMTIGDEEINMETSYDEDGGKGSTLTARLRKHFSDNRALYVPMALMIGFVALLVVGMLVTSGDEDTKGEDDGPCIECLKGEPDECGVVPFSLYPFSDGFPVRRNYRPQYNGNPGSKFEAGMPVETVFKAILGEVTARKTSTILRWVMDNATNNENAFWKARKADPRAQAYLPLVSNLTDATIEYLQQLGYDFKGEGAADSKHLPAEARRQVLCAASRVLNSYWQNLTVNELIIGHLHYNNSWFGYDNRGSLSVWTTIYQEVASYYGPLLVVFRPEVTKDGVPIPETSTPRTCDVNMYNLANIGYFVFPNNSEWADTGEFIASGWRSAKDVMGLIMHPKVLVKPSNTSITYFPVLFSFWKVEQDGVPYVVVLDGHLSNGNRSTCVEEGDDGFHYHCVFEPWQFEYPYPAFPTLLPERCRVIGFISACPANSTSCKPSKKLIARYSALTSGYTIPDVLQTYIVETQWQDSLTDEAKKLFFYPMNSTAIVHDDLPLPVLDRDPWM